PSSDRLSLRRPDPEALVTNEHVAALDVRVQRIESARRRPAQAATVEIERRGVTGTVELARAVVEVDPAAEVRAHRRERLDRAVLGGAHQPARTEGHLVEAEPGVLERSHRGRPQRFARLHVAFGRDPQGTAGAATGATAARRAPERAGEEAEPG